MSRVEINAGGRHIIVDHTGDLEPIRQAAQSLWESTADPVPPGPAVGFTSDRRATATVPATGRGAYDRGVPVAPVEAELTGGADGRG